MKSYKDLHAFYKLTNILLKKNLKFNTRLKKALKIILDHIQSEKGSIMLLEENKFLKVVASTEPSILNLKVDLENGKGPAIEAFKQKKIVKKESISKDDKKYKGRHFVIFPIIVNNKAYGVLNITNKINDGAYSDSEIKVIKKFVDSISILIENAYLEKELLKEKENLEKLNKELKETQRLKDELTHLIIHDLKSPLSQIVANLDLLYQNKNLSDEDFEIIDAALQGCEDLNRLILNILDIYRIENNKIVLNKTKEDINQLIEDVLNKFKGLIKTKQLNVSKRLDKKLCLVLIDRQIITRVLNNLIHNAIIYTPEGENIIIRTKCKENFFEISIKNTGVGIPKERIKNIFNKFYSTFRKQESTGLGLTFCKLAVEAHNGTIKVSSKENEWTKFTITLPVEEEITINKKIFDLTL